MGGNNEAGRKKIPFGLLKSGKFRRKSSGNSNKIILAMLIAHSS